MASTAYKVALKSFEMHPYYYIKMSMLYLGEHLSRLMDANVLVAQCEETFDRYLQMTKDIITPESHAAMQQLQDALVAHQDAFYKQSNNLLEVLEATMKILPETKLNPGDLEKLKLVAQAAVEAYQSEVGAETGSDEAP